jgi:hypothetical protein
VGALSRPTATICDRFAVSFANLFPKRGIDVGKDKGVGPGKGQDNWQREGYDLRFNSKCSPHVSPSSEPEAKR